MNPACSGPVAGYSKMQAKSLIAGVVQSVERQLPKLNVVGSIPIARSNYFGCEPTETTSGSA